MYERPLTTMLTIDLEANHRVSKHPSQNITLKPFRRFTGKAPALCHCYFFLSPAFHKYCMKGTLLLISLEYNQNTFPSNETVVPFLFAFFSSNLLQLLFEESENKEMRVT